MSHNGPLWLPQAGRVLEESISNNDPQEVHLTQSPRAQSHSFQKELGCFKLSYNTV